MNGKADQKGFYPVLATTNSVGAMSFVLNPKSKGPGLGCRGTLARRGPPKQLGVFPWLRYPIGNFNTLIPYVLIDFPDGRQRRAWLTHPEADGEIATVQLESTCMGLGCCGNPQQATIQTNTVGVGMPLPQTTPVVFTVHSNGASRRLGCSETEAGQLTYAPIDTAHDTCLSLAPTDTWFRLASCSSVNPNLFYGTVLSATTSDDRRLWALPTLDPSLFQLAWNSPAAVNTGFPARMLLVSTRDSLPCDILPSPFLVQAGPTLP